MTTWQRIARFVSKPKVADYLIRRAMKTPFSHLPTNEDPSYMARYWLFNPYPISSSNRKRWQFPWSIRIHHIKREDFDRDMHDHPWNARTIILKGWYTEKRLMSLEDPAVAKVLEGMPSLSGIESAKVTASEMFYRQPGDTATLKYAEYHTITDVSDGGVWTMFITGPWRGVWGFLVGGVKIPWKTYLGIEAEQAAASVQDSLREHDIFVATSKAAADRLDEIAESFSVDPPHKCKFCGAPCWLDESDQTAPPDYCHESDHGNREDYLADLLGDDMLKKVSHGFHTGGYVGQGHVERDLFSNTRFVPAYVKLRPLPPVASVVPSIIVDVVNTERPDDVPPYNLLGRNLDAEQIRILNDYQRRWAVSPGCIEDAHRKAIRELQPTIDCHKVLVADQARRAAGMLGTYHPLKCIAEWRKGCSCALSGNPAECIDCTTGLINAIESWFKEQEGKAK